MAPAILGRFRPAPLSSGFFLTAILGLLITLFYFDDLTATRFGKSVTLACIIIFIAMFVASLISMRRAPISAQFALDHHVSKSGTNPLPANPLPAQVAKPAKRASASKPAGNTKPARKVSPARKPVSKPLGREQVRRITPKSRTSVQKTMRKSARKAKRSRR